MNDDDLKTYEVKLTVHRYSTRRAAEDHAMPTLQSRDSFTREVK